MWLVVLIGLAAGAALVAQGGGAQTTQGGGAQTAQGQQDPQRPVFRGRIDTITVDVSVTDRDGRAVTDLRPEDFEIREAGKVQKIDTFQFVAADAVDEALDPARARQITSFGDQQREAADTRNRLILIFLDDYHVRLGNSLQIRVQLASFVRQLGPRDLVAILYPWTPVAAVTFSRNHDGTASALMQFRGRKYDYNPANDYERRMVGMPPEAIEDFRNDTTIRALESACAYLSTLREGRKMMLFVSEGFSANLPAGAQTTGSLYTGQRTSATGSREFFNSADLLGRMRDLFTAASRGNTSIYTLDPRGLSPNEFQTADRVDFETDRRVLNDAIDSLRTIADETDGRAVVNRNDAVPELQKIVRENATYYLLTYTSTESPRDGRFHPIQVRVNRRDVEIRARKGYWAFTEDEARKAETPPREAPPPAITEALDELAATVEPGRRRDVAFWLGASKGQDDRPRVTLAWEATARAGMAVDDRPEQVTVTATSASGDVLFQGPIARAPAAPSPAGHVSFDAPPGPLRIRAVPENARGQRLEPDELFFDVPDFAAVGPSLGTPALYRGRTARDLAQIRAGAAGQPTASRQFSRTERLLIRIPAYGPGGTAPALTARLLNRLGEPLAPLPAPSRGTDGAFEVEVVLGGLSPGDYLIEIAAAAAGETAVTLIGARITG